MRRWLPVAAGITLVLTGTGCVTCTRPQSHAASHDAGPNCDVPRCARERVYAFLIGGLNPWCTTGFNELEACLNRHGFSKVGRVGCFHGSWLVGEMERIRANDDEARFVLIAHDVGGTTAAKVASQAAEQGIPVDAMVLLDPVGPPSLRRSPPVRTILLRSVGGTSQITDAEIIPVPDATPFTLASSPTTLATVAGVVEEVAMSVWSEMPHTIKPMSWDASLVPAGPAFANLKQDDPTGAWSFLNERVGGTTPSIPGAIEDPRQR